jgi:fibronectin type 3 domain-containing protein
MKSIVKTIIILCALQNLAFSQAVDSTRFAEHIAIAARPSADSINLRWAPLSFSVWKKGNEHGYVIERYVMVRNDKVLTTPEKTVLTVIPLKPLPEEKWEPIVKTTNYAAIAAQALYGDKFEVDLGKTDVLTIVNKVRENEQRFSFALFAADISPVTAKASGLWFTDKKVMKGEKYLYRIHIATADSLRGSIFISSHDPYSLTAPQNLSAEFKDNLVSLRWEKNKVNTYTAYQVERSSDGKTFKAISDVPIITVLPTEQADSRFEYATDSLPDMSTNWHYRVKGITPFGDYGNPSNVVSGKGNPEIKEVPHINADENIDNNRIRIMWEFSSENQKTVKSFSVERSSKPQGTYNSISPLLPPSARSFEDKTPSQVNYYRIVANGFNGEKFRSPIYLSQLVDSIPPATPIGITAKADEYGNVELLWEANKDADIFGYRVYRGNHENEELSQVTTEPVRATSFSDKVAVNTLNKSVFYCVMAIDNNQNHSGLSSILKVSLPDKIKPQPAAFLPVKSNEHGVILSWIRSGSHDVVRYEVYRQASDKREWQRIKSIAATSDTTYSFTDDNASTARAANYTVIAIDDAGLESDPATPVKGGKIDNALHSAIRWKEPVKDIDKNTILLSWEHTASGIKAFQLYKAENKNPLSLYRTLPGGKFEFADVVKQGKEYQYAVLVIFENGTKSKLSEPVVVQF